MPAPHWPIRLLTRPVLLASDRRELIVVLVLECASVAVIAVAIMDARGVVRLTRHWHRLRRPIPPGGFHATR